jgi:hypothetical protein
MIKDTKQQQESGDNSQNIQAQTINQYGLSYRDVKAIVEDETNAKFREFLDIANIAAKERDDYITNSVLEKIQNTNPLLLEAFKEPSMKAALYSAQKGYVISGEKEVGDLLVDILVDRANQQERDLKQIVLDESLEVVPKLTLNQLDTLTLIFLLKYSTKQGINNLESFKSYLEIWLKPFTVNLSKESSCYQHLEYCNCGSMSVASITIEEIFMQNYKGLFRNGSSREEFERSYGDLLNFGDMLIPGLHNKNHLIVRVMNDEFLRTEATNQNLTEENIAKLKQFYDNTPMPINEVKAWIETQGEFMKTLIDYWNESEMKSMTLTSVGISIAQANFRKKTGITIDLSIWIK